MKMATAGFVFVFYMYDVRSKVSTFDIKSLRGGRWRWRLLLSGVIVRSHGPHLPFSPEVNLSKWLTILYYGVAYVTLGRSIALIVIDGEIQHDTDINKFI